MSLIGKRIPVAFLWCNAIRMAYIIKGELPRLGSFGILTNSTSLKAQESGGCTTYAPQNMQCG